MAQMFSLKPVGTGRAEIIEITVRKILAIGENAFRPYFVSHTLSASGLLLEIPNHAV